MIMTAVEQRNQPTSAGGLRGELRAITSDPAALQSNIQPGRTYVSCTKRLKHDVRFALIRVAAACVSLLPLRFASALGARCGALAWSIAFRERKKALDSLAIAFPERAEAGRRALGRACFAHLGRVACELACLTELDRSIDTLVDWPAESRAVLDAAMARKKGVIFVSGHVGH
jgi:KDO2-lipid IV(A) lauroyltransferase